MKIFSDISMLRIGALAPGRLPNFDQNYIKFFRRLFLFLALLAILFSEREKIIKLI